MKMSVTRALAMMKQLDDRITRAVRDGKFVAITVGRNQQQKVDNFNGSVQQAENIIQGDYDRVEALINNRSVLKSAIVLSNATTNVVVGGSEITVAEAIERRTGLLGLKREYLAQLQEQLTQASRHVVQRNQKVEQQIEASINTVYGNDKGKVDESMFKSIAEPRLASSEAALLDPMGIREKIEKLSNEVSELDTELDFILSESNARTEIEVELQS